MSQIKKIATPSVIGEFAKKYDFFVISESIIDGNGKTLKKHLLIKNFSPDKKGVSMPIAIISIPNGQVMKWETIGVKRLKAKDLNEITTKLAKYV